MRKFFIFCFMAFVMCVNANAQSPYKLTTDDNGHLVVTNNTYSEADWDDYYYNLYNLGCENVQKGLKIFCTSSILTLAADTAIIYACDNWYTPMAVVSVVGVIVDCIGIWYIYNGYSQRYESMFYFNGKGFVYNF